MFEEAMQMRSYNPQTCVELLSSCIDLLHRGLEANTKDVGLMRLCATAMMYEMEELFRTSGDEIARTARADLCDLLYNASHFANINGGRRVIRRVLAIVFDVRRL